MSKEVCQKNWINQWVKMVLATSGEQANTLFSQFDLKELQVGGIGSFFFLFLFFLKKTSHNSKIWKLFELENEIGNEGVLTMCDSIQKASVLESLGLWG